MVLLNIMKQESPLVFFRYAPLRIKIRLIAIAASAVVIVCVSTYSVGAIIWHLAHHQEGTVESHDTARVTAVTEKPRDTAAFSFSYEIKNISIMLMDKKRQRTAHAQFSLIFDCPNQNGKRLLELNRAKILDSIFEVATPFFIEDFSSEKGFMDFKEALLAQYQTHFHELAPRDIVIQDWVLN